MWFQVVVVALVAWEVCEGLAGIVDVTLNSSCHPVNPCQRDHTYTNVTGAWDDVNCFCDDRCIDYADCCIDAQKYDAEKYRANSGRFSCVTLTQYGEVSMVATCPDVWRDDEVTARCVAPPSAHQDPVATLPATSTATNLTYANYYCAICNDDSHSLTLWQSRWECASGLSALNLTKEDLASRITFANNTWGVEVVGDVGKEVIACAMYPSLPTALESVTRPCHDALHTCAPDWRDAAVADMCHSYTAVVFNLSIAIRNPHCAVCNHLPVNDTTCDTFFVSPRHRDDELFNPQAFALLFDFADGSGSNVVGSTSPCQDLEIWDPFFRRCRSVVCWREDQTYVNGSCVSGSDLNASTSTDPTTLSTPPTTTNTTSTPTTLSTPPTTTNTTSTPNNFITLVFPVDPVDLSTTTHSTKETANKNIAVIFPDDKTPTEPTTVSSSSPTTPPTTPIPNTTTAYTNTTLVSNTPPSSNGSALAPLCRPVFLLEEDYTTYDNGIIHVANYDRNYTAEEYVVREGGVVVCPPVFQEAKFSRVMGWLTLAGLGLSCACLLIHLVAFTMVPELRYLSGKNLACLSTTLVLGYGVFIGNVFNGVEGAGCLALAAAMYYLFLASVCWMNAIAFDIWLTFHLGKKELRAASGSQWCKFVGYCVYSWGAPAIATAILLLLDTQRPAGVDIDFLPHLGAVGERFCWFGRRKALFVFFAIPIVVMIVMNVVLFVCTAWIIAETSISTPASTFSPHHRSHFKLYLRLAVLTGFTWLSGILAGYLGLEALWYVFVLLNTLQGVFIFLAFTCRTKVWRTMRARSRGAYLRGASRLVRPGNGSQGVELHDAPDLNSSTPATSLDQY